MKGLSLHVWCEYLRLASNRIVLQRLQAFWKGRKREEELFILLSCEVFLFGQVKETPYLHLTIAPVPITTLRFSSALRSVHLLRYQIDQALQVRLDSGQ